LCFKAFAHHNAHPGEAALRRDQLLTFEDFPVIRLAAKPVTRDPVINWQRIGIGVTLIGVGLTLLILLPLPRGQGILPILLRYGLSLAALSAFVGAGTIMSAFPQKRRRQV
jgi:hypothetical protein